MSNEETAPQFVGSRVCTKGDNSMIIAADGPVNNMSHVVKTESTSDFLLWYSLVEVIANHLDTLNSSILKSFLRESIENLLIILALSAQLQDILTSSLILSNFSHIFAGCSKDFSWFCCRLVFHILWFEISETLWTKIHLSWEEFSHIPDRYVNTFRIDNVNTACLNKTFLLKRITAEILKNPSYIRCELLLKCRCILVGKHCLRFRRCIDSFFKRT